MKGDKLIIEEHHFKAARQLTDLLLPQIMKIQSKFIATIAGESGSGKSEIAAALSTLLLENNEISTILQQDDYFVYPPKTNSDIRRKNISHVGLSEVRLDLLDRNLKDIIDGKDEIEKPLVIFDEDRIATEVIRLKTVKVIIVEGTFTTVLDNAHRHVFIDRTYIDTRESRKKRAREKQDKYLEKILEIEHRIISCHKSMADIIITADYEVILN